MTKKLPYLLPGPKVGYVVVFGDTDWAAIERAFGHTLPKSARELIGLATLYLTLGLPKEQNAPKIHGKSNLLLRIQRLIDEAKTIRSALYPPHYWNDDDGTPISLQMRLGKQLDGADAPEEVFCISLTGVVESGSEVLQAARKSTRREGDVWNRWVAWLTVILSSFNLPTGIRSEVYRVRRETTPEAAPSPFVRLIKAIETIACRDRRRSLTDGGLAKAIDRARRALKIPKEIPGDPPLDTAELKRVLIRVLGVEDDSSDYTLQYLPLNVAVKMVIKGDRPGIYPLVPDLE